MKKNSLKLIVIICISTCFLTSCGSKEGNPQMSMAGMPAAPYPVSQIATKTVTGYQEYPANIEGVVSSDIRAKVSGYIKQVLVDDGQKVHKGQMLFKLETQSLNGEAESAKANVNVAQVEVDKLIPLVEKNIMSPIKLETAKANLAQAKAGYNSIVSNIEYATVKSPVDGFVGAINFRQGALIAPNDGTPLTTVTDTRQVYAFFSLNESDYLDFLQKTEGKNLKEKMANFPEVSLMLTNGTTYSEKGKIQTSSGQINPNTGTVSFRAIFNNPNQILTNGNSGRIKIPTIYKNAVVIPQAATFEQQKDVLIYKLGANNLAESSIIKIKASVDNLYVVASGLKAGDKIITSGVGKLRNGMAVSPQNVDFDSVIKPIKPLFRN